MIKKIAKIAIVLASSAVAVPYTVAFLANVLKGWPLGRNKYRRALHPRKVYALNYAVLQQFGKLKYTILFLKWRSYYKKCTTARLVKDIPYGNNENTLDLYFPRRRTNTGELISQTPEGGQPWPVVVYVFGGSWGSGDKDMYGLLCSRIADQLQAIVCCPNYSIYPKGYVDDMVQDVVDCLAWIHSYIHNYSGDKDRIMLIGHSAGAHLCMMTALELTLKRLLHNPDAIIMPEGFAPQTPQIASLGESIRFHDKYFDGSSTNDTESSDLTVTPPVLLSGPATPPVLRSGHSTPPVLRLNQESGQASADPFYLIDNSNNGKEHKSSDSDQESFYLINKDNGSNNGNDVADDLNKSEEEELLKNYSEEAMDDKTEEQTKEESNTDDKDSSEQKAMTKENNEEQGTTNIPVEIKAVPAESKKGFEELVIEDDDILTQAQRDVRNLLNSIKHIIGLAGVYDIGDHYNFESWRGIEDVSTMTKAMYSPEHFERFSPSHIVSSLPARIRMPAMTVVHGDKDWVVPPSSTSKYVEQCVHLGTHVNELHVPECDHYDLCLDLMDPEREFHHVVMGVIQQVAQTYL